MIDQLVLVAPRVGAWIETAHALRPEPAQPSRPAWARGLKHEIDRGPQRAGVAPRVGAWIETCSIHVAQSLEESRPAWARGLKQSIEK